MAVKILAADDSATMRKVLEMTFAGEAVEIETVDSGEAAVQRASQSPPDLVIADASMSTDGYDVARQLKGNPATSNVAVMVLASQHTPFDASKGKDAGVDDHILKPYDSQAMIDKAKEILSKPRASASAASPVAAAPRAPQSPLSPPSPPSPPRPASRTPGIGRPSSQIPAANPRSTVAFGAVSPPKPSDRPVLQLADEDEPKAAPQAKIASPAVPSRPTPKRAVPPTASKPAVTPAPAPRSPAPSAAAAAATSSNGDLAAKLGDLGLDAGQIEGVLSLSREVIERVVWEVVPELAEVIIREEIRRLTSD